MKHAGGFLKRDDVRLVAHEVKVGLGCNGDPKWKANVTVCNTCQSNLYVRNGSIRGQLVGISSLSNT